MSLLELTRGTVTPELAPGTVITQALVTLDISNWYPDGEVRVRHLTLLPLPVPEEGTADREDWEWDNLLVHTGTGREDGDAFYSVTATDASVPELNGLTVEFGG